MSRVQIKKIKKIRGSGHGTWIPRRLLGGSIHPAPAQWKDPLATMFTWPSGGTESASRIWYHNASRSYELIFAAMYCYVLLVPAISSWLFVYAAIYCHVLLFAFRCCHLLLFAVTCACVLLFDPICCSFLLFTTMLQFAGICSYLLLFVDMCCCLLLFVAY